MDTDDTSAKHYFLITLPDLKKLDWDSNPQPPVLNSGNLPTAPPTIADPFARNGIPGVLLTGGR